MKFKTALAIATLFCAAPLLGQESAAQQQKPATQPPATAAQTVPAPKRTPEQIDPAKKAAIKHLMDLTETSRLGESISTAISSQVRSVVGHSMPQDRLEKFMASFDQKFQAHASEDGIEKLIIPIYAEHFSTEDIQQLVQFYESPLGQRVIKTLPEVAQQSQNAGMEFEREAALTTLHEMSDEYPELKPMLPAQDSPSGSTPSQPTQPAPSPAGCRRAHLRRTSKTAMLSPAPGGVRRDGKPAVGRLCIAWIAAILLAAAASAGGIGSSRPETITVSAAISLKGALDEIGPAFERGYPAVRVAFNYAGSGTLQQQIEQGAPVDVFVSAGKRQMDALEAKGLIAADTRRDIAGNTLVLIVPVSSKSIRDVAGLAQPQVRVIAMGDPATVPAGRYAQQALEHLGLLGALRKKFVYAKDVRQVLTFVETGNADAGFVYATDARVSPKVRVAARLAAESHAPIIYPAAVVRSSKHMETAREFLRYLQGAEARAVLTKNGFAIPKS